MEPSPAPRFVFVAFYPGGPHAGPVSIGLFGVRDGALLPVFSSREKAIDFAVRVLGSPLNRGESWGGVELPAEDLIHLLASDESIEFVAVDPAPSGDVELTPTQQFIEVLKIESEGQPQGDFRRSFVQTLVYGDVS